MTKTPEPGRNSPTPLPEVVLRFWWPVYGECRQRGHTESEAQHLMSVILGRAADSGSFFRADDHGGRLRQVVRAEVERVLSNPDRFQLSPYLQGVPKVDLRDPGDYTPTPGEDGFTGRWAIVLLELAMDELRREYRALGKAELLSRLEPQLSQRPEGRSGEASKASADAVEINILRERFREWVRRLTGETVTTPMALEAELTELFGNP